MADSSTQTEVVQFPEHRPRPTPENVSAAEPNFCNEFFGTIQNLLQHLVFAFLLAGRLYVLPLLYVARKLASPSDSWIPPSWTFVRPDQVLTNLDQPVWAGGYQVVVGAWHNLKSGLLNNLEIAGSLYTLGKMIVEETGHPQEDVITLLDVSPRESESEDSTEELDTGEHEPETSAIQHTTQISASQMYHAALLDNSTLDDLLAAFEVDQEVQDIVVDRVLIHRSLMSSLPAPKSDALRSQRQRRHSDLSMPLTRRGTITDIGVDLETPVSSAQHAAPNGARTLSNPGPATNEALVGKKVNVEDSAYPAQETPGIDATSRRDISGAQSVIRHASLHTMNRCPTFVRRQAQSLLPRPSVSKSKSSLDMLKKRGAMSTPVLASSPPPKQRARLQRKAKPKLD